MTLIKTSVLSFIATVIKILAGLVINKAIALYIGPTGLALIGQFQNFSQLAMTAAQGAINTGVTKYTAEYGKNSNRIPILFSTSSKISLLSSVIVGFGIIIFSDQASVYFLKSDNYRYIFFIFGFTIILFVINNLLLSILNGLKEIKTWVSINIIQSIYSLVFTTLLIYWLGLDGALIASVTNQSFIFIITLWMLRKHSIINFKNFQQAFDKSEAKKLSGFAVMAIASAVTIPLSHIIIRNYITEELGLEQAGYWQAIWYISNMYLMVASTSLGIYYLPKLAEINTKKELYSELFNGYIIITPIIVISATGIFLLKDFIILALFTEKFSPMKELFFWQLIGDIIRTCAWILSYLIVSKAMIKTFVFSEVIFAITFTLTSIVFIDFYGLIGITYSHVFTCIVYFTYYFFASKLLIKTIGYKS